MAQPQEEAEERPYGGTGRDGTGPDTDWRLRSKLTQGRRNPYPVSSPNAPNKKTNYHPMRSEAAAPFEIPGDWGIRLGT